MEFDDTQIVRKGAVLDDCRYAAFLVIRWRYISMLIARDDDSQLCVFDIWMIGMIAPINFRLGHFDCGRRRRKLHIDVGSEPRAKQKAALGWILLRLGQPDFTGSYRKPFSMPVMGTLLRNEFALNGYKTLDSPRDLPVISPA
jgi:hypothetical protein